MTTKTASGRGIGTPHAGRIWQVVRKYKWKGYFVSLPTEEAHSGHPTGDFSGFSQRIHSLLIEQIIELVSAGITNTGEVKRLYTRNALAKHLGIQVTQQPSSFSNRY